MNDSPFLLILIIAGGVWVSKIWLDDLRNRQAGRPHPGALPGATPAPRRAVVIAVAGAMVLLGLETIGENALGLTEQQSRMTILFGISTLAAAVIEEVIFRGFLVINGRGPAVRIAGIIAASLVFALLHPFLWKWEGGLVWTTDAKGWFSTGAIFAGSLWFYAVRFASFNPQHSLLPCFAAHAAKNLGVFVIKAGQGYVDGGW